jgi:hypothetical protein
MAATLRIGRIATRRTRAKDAPVVAVVGVGVADVVAGRRENAAAKQIRRSRPRIVPSLRASRATREPNASREVADGALVRDGPVVTTRVVAKSRARISTTMVWKKSSWTTTKMISTKMTWMALMVRKPLPLGIASGKRP